jgi:hypothetical protein
MRPAALLPAAVDATLHPSLARVAVPHRLGGVEVVLVLLVGSYGVMGALWVLGGRCVDATIGDA